jgi:hypothetical protein
MILNILMFANGGIHSATATLPTSFTSYQEYTPVRVRVTLWLAPISSSWRQVPWDSRPLLFSQLNTCGYSSYVTSSLTREWVCRLQLLLVLASAVILGSKSRGTNDLEGQVPVFISPRNRIAQLYPQALGSFRRLLRLAGLRWRYSNPSPQWIYYHDLPGVSRIR